MTTKDKLIKELIEENTKLRKMLGETDPCSDGGDLKMYDARQIMRAMLFGLAPPEHRKLPFEKLRQMGYTRNAAEALVLAAKEQQQPKD